jgi:hypothetical protein
LINRRVATAAVVLFNLAPLFFLLDYRVKANESQLQCLQDRQAKQINSNPFSSADYPLPLPSHGSHFWYCATDRLHALTR